MGSPSAGGNGEDHGLNEYFMSFTRKLTSLTNNQEATKLVNLSVDVCDSSDLRFFFPIKLMPLIPPPGLVTLLMVTLIVCSRGT